MKTTSKKTRKPSANQVWTCNLTMTLGRERTNLSYNVDLSGHARDVIEQLTTARNEVSEAVHSAVTSIIQSAQGFGVRRDGK